MTTLPFKMGRIHQPDPRDHNFLMASQMPEKAARTSVTYRTGPVLDQGQTPMCVGMAWRDWLSAALVMEKGGPAAPVIYADAQQRDGMALPHDGSTVRAGAQALQALGYVQAYGWAFDATTLRNWLLLGKGSVVVGTNWYDAMFEPDAKGFCRVGGSIAGGHAYLCIGYSAPRQAFRFLNSWGLGWGQKGRFWISFSDFDRLLHENGECCTAIEQRVSA